MDNYTTIPLKVCTKCQRLLPATLFFFHRNNACADGLNTFCKTCKLAQNKAYHDNHIDEYKEYQHQYRQENQQAISVQRRQHYEENKERILEQQRQYNENHKEQIAERKRQYGQENRDKIREYRRNKPVSKEKQAEYNRRYRLKHYDRILDREREYRKSTSEKQKQWKRKYTLANLEKVRAKSEQWRKANPEKARATWSRRRARVRGLPDTFTGEQWLHCLEYFNYTCAVCGFQLRDLFGNVEPHADHWHPLSVEGCPGTVAENMVCLCSDCNRSKHNKLPLIWLTEKYSKRKAQEILARIQAYFASLV